MIRPIVVKLCTQGGLQYLCYIVATGLGLNQTAKTCNTENLKQIFPVKELRGLNPNFHIHVSVSDFYIPTLGLPILLQENMWTDPVSVSDLYIPTIGLPILLQENIWADPVSVSDLYISTIGLRILLQENMWTDPVSLSDLYIPTIDLPILLQ
jgi:hypothetical protein